jgi:hypothetical protein
MPGVGHYIPVDSENPGDESTGLLLVRFSDRKRLSGSEEMRRQLQEMLVKGIVTPCESL